MNTREREEVLKVMDALANALRSARDSVCGELTHERAAFKGYEGSSNIASLEAELVAIDSAIAAYDCLTTDEHDALLAEGSASSEGAEAVAPVAWMTPGNNFLLSDHAKRHGVPPAYGMKPSDASIPLYTRPQPAQGEPESGLRDAYEGAREDLLDWKGRAQRAEARLRNLGWAGVDASEPPSGEHEQRSSEGSDRKCSCGLSTCVEPWEPGCGLGTSKEHAVAVSGDVEARIDAAVTAESEQRPIADEVVEPCESEARVRAVHALAVECGAEFDGGDPPSEYSPGIPPTYTFTAREFDDFVDRLAALESALPRGLPAASDDAGSERERLALLGFAAIDATAEQPSCGQNARDAERYRHIRRNDVHCDRFHHTVSDDCHPPTRQLKHGEELDAAIDAAIAAQQRQGGTP
jgi:hypothetical protein